MASKLVSASGTRCAQPRGVVAVEAEQLEVADAAHARVVDLDDGLGAEGAGGARGRRGGRGDHGLDAEAVAREGEEFVEEEGLLEDAPHDVKDVGAVPLRGDGGDLDVGGVEAEEDGGIDRGDLVAAAPRAEVDDLALGRDDGDAPRVLEEPVAGPSVDARAGEGDALPTFEAGDDALGDDGDRDARRLVRRRDRQRFARGRGRRGGRVARA